MTDEQMRVAIAEACGWEPDQHFNDPIHWHKGIGYARGVEELPDYCNDLNAMHAAEAGLLGHQMIAYQGKLSSLTTKNPHVSCWDLIHVTAHQRAETFLRTISKWQEDKQ